MFTQKEGICIGSVVALAFSEVFLRSLDGVVKLLVDSQPVVHIYVGRFVDNVLVGTTSADMVDQLRGLIVVSNNELHFASEEPVYGCLQATRLTGYLPGNPSFLLSFVTLPL